jgi:DNA-binding CsgD family transcriptional regulator
MSLRRVRSVEVIDRNLPAHAPLFDEMRDRLRAEHGVTKARYFHAVPTATGGGRLEISASPLLRPLAEDYVSNRRHELDFTLLPKMRRPEPTRWVDQPRDEECPPSILPRRAEWRAWARKVMGEGWEHGFDVPVFGPGGRRGLFKIHAPLEQPLGRAYMRGVQSVVQDFHLAYCAVRLAAAPRVRLAPEEQEALTGAAAGLNADTIGYESGIKRRTVEDRLGRAREQLGCRTTPEAVAKAVTLGLIL